MKANVAFENLSDWNRLCFYDVIYDFSEPLYILKKKTERANTQIPANDNQGPNPHLFPYSLIIGIPLKKHCLNDI